MTYDFGNIISIFDGYFNIIYKYKYMLTDVRSWYGVGASRESHMVIGSEGSGYEIKLI